MEVKSDLSGVQVGDVLESLRFGPVKVTNVGIDCLTCSILSRRVPQITTWEVDGKYDAEDPTPDLYYPGVQIVPGPPPKRMKKVTVRAWACIVQESRAGLTWLKVSVPRSTPGSAQEQADTCPSYVRVSDPFEITHEIEVEDV